MIATLTRLLTDIKLDDVLEVGVDAQPRSAGVVIVPQAAEAVVLELQGGLLGAEAPPFTAPILKQTSVIIYHNSIVFRASISICM